MRGCALALAALLQAVLPAGAQPGSMPVAPLSMGNDAAALPAFAPRLGPVPRQLPPEREAERQRLLGEVRSALAAGDAAAAQQGLDVAAGMSHAADTELLIVQWQMQRGAYREAASFAAHAAAAHREQPQALALYIWLTALGGQQAFASRQLEAAVQRRPGDATGAELQALLRRLAAGERASDDEVPAPPGPVPTGLAVPDAARVVSGGLLLDGGAAALVPLSAFDSSAGRLWVRNGLGRASSATVQQRLPAQGLALLAVDPPLPTGPVRAAAAPAVFAGSAVSVAGFAGPSAGVASWPSLNLGFLGRGEGAAPSSEVLRTLGLQLPAQPAGAPVFDFQGRLVGVTAAGSDGAADRVLAIGAVRAALADRAQAWLPAATDIRRHAPDELYELALPLTLQVLSEKPPPGSRQ